MEQTIQFVLNGKPERFLLKSDRMLLWVLRTEFHLTGAKFGCGEGFCGACTVLVGKKPVRSCQFPAKDVQGKEVITIEGLAKEGKLHPLQKAFIAYDALQCGFCTPGMICNALSLLLENAKPTREEILKEMENNLCRCGAHTRIVDAIEAAAREMRQGEGR